MIGTLTIIGMVCNICGIICYYILRKEIKNKEILISQLKKQNEFLEKETEYLNSLADVCRFILEKDKKLDLEQTMTIKWVAEQLINCNLTIDSDNKIFKQELEVLKKILKNNFK